MMRQSGILRPHGRGSVLGFLVWLVLLVSTGSAWSQAAPPQQVFYSRKNTFGFLVGYSNDSSHILLGVADNRKLLSFGGMYARRLLQDHIVNWQYSVEVLPVALESDPVLHEVVTYTSPTNGVAQDTRAVVPACQPGSGSFSQTVDGVTYSYTYVDTCSRQWTVGEGMSPVGFQWNFLPRHKLQPFLTGHGGYMYSSRPIPDAYAGSFNFTFDGGAGFELYRSRTRSIRAEFRYHHISNHETARDNPGIDNGVFQITYAFGR